MNLLRIALISPKLQPAKKESGRSTHNAAVHLIVFMIVHGLHDCIGVVMLIIVDDNWRSQKCDGQYRDWTAIDSKPHACGSVLMGSWHHQGSPVLKQKSVEKTRGWTLPVSQYIHYRLSLLRSYLSHQVYCLMGMKLKFKKI